MPPKGKGGGIKSFFFAINLGKVPIVTAVKGENMGDAGRGLSVQLAMKYWRGVRWDVNYYLLEFKRLNLYNKKFRS